MAIFCLTLVALGTAFYFLSNDDPPNTSAQNVTNVNGTPLASDKALGKKLGNYVSETQSPATLQQNHSLHTTTEILMLIFKSDLKSCEEQAKLWRIDEEKESAQETAIFPNFAKLYHILQEERVLPGEGRAPEVGERTGSAD